MATIFLCFASACMSNTEIVVFPAHHFPIIAIFMLLYYKVKFSHFVTFPLTSKYSYSSHFKTKISSVDATISSQAKKSLISIFWSRSLSKISFPNFSFIYFAKN